MDILQLPLVITKRVGQRSLRLRVNTVDSSLQVSAPYFVSKAKIIEFVLSQEQWIKAQLIKINADAQVTETYYLGLKYQVIFEMASKPNYFIQNNKIVLGIKGEAKDLQDRSKQVQALQRMRLEQMRLILPARVKSLAEQVNTPVKLVRFRSMKTQWGNCYPHKRLITLNTELIKYPMECIDYVIFHELAHFHHFNHGSEFKSLLDKWCPNWTKLRQQLKILK